MNGGWPDEWLETLMGVVTICLFLAALFIIRHFVADVWGV